MLPRTHLQATVGWPYVRRSAPGAALVGAEVAAGLLLLANGGAPVWVGRALLLSAGVLAASLLNAELGALALLGVLFARLSELWVTGAPLAVGELIVALPVLALTTRQILRRGLRPVRSPLVIAMLVCASVPLVSNAAAATPANGVAEFSAQLRQIGLVIVLATLISGIAGLRRASWVMIGVGVFAAVTGVLGEMLGRDLGGLAIVEHSQIVGPLDGSRLGGLMGESNWFALMLLPLVPLALYRAWYESGVVLRLAGLGSAAAISLGIMLTFSRAGFVGLLAALALLAVRQRGHPARLLLLAMVPVVLLAATPPSYWQRMFTLGELVPGSSPEDESLRDRWSLAQVGLLMLVDHPVAGVGHTNYAALYSSYAPVVDPTLPNRRGKPLLYTHSGPVQIAADGGLLGLATFGIALGLIAAVSRRTILRLKSTGDSAGAMLLEAAQVSIGAYLVASVFMDGSYDRYFWSLIGLVVIGELAAHTSTASASADWRWWRKWPGAIIRSYQRATE
jgi:O-antigen ligase